MQLKNTSIVWRSYEFWKTLGTNNEFWPDNNGCKFLRNYVWTVIWKTVFLFILGFFLLGGLFDLGIIAFNPHSFWLILPAKIYEWTDLLPFAGQVLGIFAAAAAVILVALGILFSVAWLWERYIAGTGDRLSETMVGQYISGVVHKFCPSLSFVDAEGNPLEDPRDKEWREYCERRGKYQDESTDSDEALASHETTSSESDQDTSNG